MKLISLSQSYLQSDSPVPELVQFAQSSVVDMLNIFGLETTDTTSKLSENLEKIDPYVDVIIQLRSQMKEIALKSEPSTKKQIFGVLDELRDRTLPKIGIKIEERKDFTIWKKLE